MTFRNFAKFWLPLTLWAVFIFSASTDALSAEHTSRFFVPFLRWLMPDLSLATIETIHAAIRKGSHLAEYAIFAALFGVRFITAEMFGPASALKRYCLTSSGYLRHG